MKNALRLGLVVSFVLLLAVSATGCTSSTNTANTATPTPQAIATAQATVKPTATPVAAKPTTTAAQLDAYFVSNGYTISSANSFSKTNLRGDSIYTGMVIKNGKYTATDITICSDSSDAAYDLKIGVTAAESLGYTGGYVSATEWKGTTTSGHSVDLYTTSGNWSIMLMTA